MVHRPILVPGLLLLAGVPLAVTAVMDADGWLLRALALVAGTGLLGAAIHGLRRRGDPGMPYADLMQRALEACPQGVVITDPNLPDNPIVFVNTGFLAMTGYARDEVMGRNCRFLQSVDTPIETHERLRACLKSGQPFLGLMGNQRKDGSRFWNRLTISPIRAANGHITHFIGIQMDATAEIEAERRLRQSEARFRAVVEVLDEGIVLQGLDGRVIIANPAAECILGLSADELHGRSSLDPRWRALREDGSDYPGDQHPAMVALRTGHPQTNVIMGVERPAGGRAWIAINSHPLRATDESRHWAVVTSFTDITSHRERELMLRELGAFQRAILDGADRGIIATDTAGIIRLFSAGAERLLGWRAEEVVGVHTPAIIHDGAEVVRRAAELSIELGHPVAPGFEVFVAHARRGQAEEREWTYLRKDGGRVPVALSVTALRDRDGAITAFLGVANDISQRREHERALREAMAAAEAGARAKAEFLATMSHEIRTPLNGIIGVADLLRETRVDAVQRDYVDMIRVSGDTLLGLINDILDFSKIEAGRLEMEDIPFDPRQIAEEAVGLLTEKARGKGLELVLDQDSALPAVVRGDPGRLRQVLVNLVGNAVKFTERGEVVVTATISAVDADRPVFTWTVRDTGIGIPASAQPSLFDAFTQADTSTTRRFGGTGLGLAISRRLVLAMGGTITVVSGPDQGSSFTVVIPLVSDGRPIAPLADAVRVRALASDHHQPTRRAMVHALAALGVGVSEAAGTDETLERLAVAHREGRPFTVLVCCHRSGDPRPLGLVEDVRRDARFAELAVLVVTHVAERPDADLVARCRVRDCLLRPIRSAALRAALTGILHGSAPSAPVKPAAPPVFEGRVLVAEDNPINQKVAVALCQRLGLRTEVAANGLEAVEAATRRPFDLILMDCQMPEMDGYAATAALRGRLEKRIPIIALTANALNEDRERCLAAGMDDHLAKPLRIEDIEAMARRWLAGKAAVGTGTSRLIRSVHLPDFEPGHLDRLLDDLDGDLEDLHGIVDPFLAGMPRDLGELRHALVVGPADAGRVAHRIKGLALLFGLTRLASLMARIEKDGHGPIEEVERSWQSARPHLERRLAELGRTG